MSPATLPGESRPGGRHVAALNYIACLLWLTMTTASLSAANPTWQKTIWHDESAWSSTQGAVRAVVTEVRCRLIYLGSVDGTNNLINAPYPHTLPDAKNPWPNQGGHRFWLGPQKRWVWPPLAEWEYSAATSVTTEDAVLTLLEPHLDATYPAITREYAWEGNRLRCTAHWPDNRRSYFGLHVIPVDLPFTVRARLAKSATVPAGAVVAEMVNAEPPLVLPHPSVSIEGDYAVMHSGIKVLKAGFVPQALTIDRPQGWKLAVLPGPNEGIVLESPDQGFLSQVWVGGPEHDLAELEQLSPYLRGGTNGRCASSIYLEATPPAGS